VVRVWWLWRPHCAFGGPVSGAAVSAAARSRLIAALGFALVNDHAPELAPIRSWLSTWSGIGLITDGMARQDYDLQLTRYDARGWRATFSRSAWLAHDGFGAGPTPWKAV
jgi:hypothetical protein